jgi:hypothetical protein
MALVLEANYSKKLGLPGYSSHQYSVTVRTELADLNQVEMESARLYRLLQSSVDREIQQTGFLPNGGSNHPLNGHTNGNGSEHWNCSPKQKELILKLVEENQLPKSKVEELAQQLFGAGVKTLNKLQASGLITELTKQFLLEERNGRSGSSPARRPA